MADAVNLLPVDFDPFNPDTLAAGATAISATDPSIVALSNAAQTQNQRLSVQPQQTSEGYPFYQAGAQPSYPEPGPTSAAPATGPVGPETPLAAWEYEPELSDGRVRDRLMAYTHAEVGNQGPAAQQAFIEATIRRAKIEGRTIDQVLSTRYYPDITHQRAARYGLTDEQRAQYDPMIQQALSGSNVSNWATGNASGTVGFAGGPQTARIGGEKYGIEGWTLGAIKEAMAGGDLVPVDYDPFERAAQRTRQSVRPEGGRHEGLATRLLETLAPNAARQVITFPQRYTQAAQGVYGGEDTGIGGMNFELLQHMAGRLPAASEGRLGAFGGRIAQPEVPQLAPGAAEAAVPGMKLHPVEHDPFAWTGAQNVEMHARAPEDFHAAISEAKAAHPYGSAVTLYKPEEYAGMQTHTSADGSAGFALNGDDIVSVFKHPNSPIPRAAESMLSSAVQMGGRRLDAFDTELPHMYGRQGFRTVARIPFDEKYAPEGWSYEQFKDFNNGRPDVVFMVRDPYGHGYYTPGEGPYVGSYEEGVAAQKRALADIGTREKAGQAQFEKAAAAVTGLKGHAQYMLPEELERVTARNGQALVDALTPLPEEEMAAVAYSGRAKRGWYRKSAQAIVNIFGLSDAPRFAGVLAALSPRASVAMNTTNGLKVWNEWVRSGRPTDLQGINNAIDNALGKPSVMEAWRGNLIRVLRADDPASVQISGPKANSFGMNLRGNVHEVTNDTWMTTYANAPEQNVSAARVKDVNPVPGMEPKIGVKSPGYIAFNIAARRAAKILSQKTGDLWTPAEVQETIWSWAKALYEKVGRGENAEELLKAGGLTHKDIADVPDFAVLFQDGIYRKLLEEGGYGPGVRSAGARPGGRAATTAGSPLSAEGSGFSQAAYEGHLAEAARRLDAVRAARQGADR